MIAALLSCRLQTCWSWMRPPRMTMSLMITCMSFLYTHVQWECSKSRSCSSTHNLHHQPPFQPGLRHACDFGYQAPLFSCVLKIRETGDEVCIHTTCAPTGYRDYFIKLSRCMVHYRVEGAGMSVENPVRPLTCTCKDHSMSMCCLINPVWCPYYICMYSSKTTLLAITPFLWLWHDHPIKIILSVVVAGAGKDTGQKGQNFCSSCKPKAQGTVWYYWCRNAFWTHTCRLRSVIVPQLCTSCHQYYSVSRWRGSQCDLVTQTETF